MLGNQVLTLLFLYRVSKQTLLLSWQMGCVTSVFNPDNSETLTVRCQKVLLVEPRSLRCRQLTQSCPLRLLQATFLFSVVHWSPLNLGKGLNAPAWATTLGWLLALSSVSLLPAWALYALATTPGTLQQVTPEPDQNVVDEEVAMLKQSNNCDFLCPRPSPSASNACAPLARTYQRPSHRQPTPPCCP